MPNLIEQMDAALGGPTSFDSPLREVDGWKFFVDGFCPFANNLMLIAKVLAWKSKDDNYYAACLGNDSDAALIRYSSGCNMPDGFVGGKITHVWFAENGAEGVQRELARTMDRFVPFVMRSEGIAVTA